MPDEALGVLRIGDLHKRLCGHRRSVSGDGIVSAAHAMHQIGGKEWIDWYNRLKTTVLPLQSSEGSWNRTGFSRDAAGPVYATSIAVISLSVQAGYLPIFQR